MNTGKAPLVSIITPSLNQGQFIERTILSVLKQDYPNIEYIVVDGVSSDSTASVLATYANRISKTIVEKDRSHGDALNKGFKCASGQILAYLNSDDCYVNKSVISKAVKALQEQKADVVYGRRQVIDAEGYFVRFEPFHEYNREVLEKACYIPQEATFWTRDIYQRAGDCIDHTLKFAVDYDLWFRFIKADAKFVAIDEQFGLFRDYVTSKTGSVWLDVGYPEARSLQEKYTGRGRNLLEMYEHNHNHTFCVDSRESAVASALNDTFHWRVAALRQQLLRSAPLDHWVFSELA